MVGMNMTELMTITKGIDSDFSNFQKKVDLKEDGSGTIVFTNKRKQDCMKLTLTNVSKFQLLYVQIKLDVFFSITFKKRFFKKLCGYLETIARKAGHKAIYIKFTFGTARFSDCMPIDFLKKNQLEETLRQSLSLELNFGLEECFIKELTPNHLQRIQSLLNVISPLYNKIDKTVISPAFKEIDKRYLSFGGLEPIRTRQVDRNIYSIEHYSITSLRFYLHGKKETFHFGLSDDGFSLTSSLGTIFVKNETNFPSEILAICEKLTTLYEKKKTV